MRLTGSARLDRPRPHAPSRRRPTQPSPTALQMRRADSSSAPTPRVKRTAPSAQSRRIAASLRRSGCLRRSTGRTSRSRTSITRRSRRYPRPPRREGRCKARRVGHASCTRERANVQRTSVRRCAVPRRRRFGGRRSRSVRCMPRGLGCAVLAPRRVAPYVPRRTSRRASRCPSHRIAQHVLDQHCRALQRCGCGSGSGCGGACRTVCAVAQGHGAELAWDGSAASFMEGDAPGTFETIADLGVPQVAPHAHSRDCCCSPAAPAHWHWHGVASHRRRSRGSAGRRASSATRAAPSRSATARSGSPPRAAARGSWWRRSARWRKARGSGSLRWRWPSRCSLSSSARRVATWARCRSRAARATRSMRRANVLHAARNARHATRNMQRATYNMNAPRTTLNAPRTTCNAPRTTCNAHATRHAQVAELAVFGKECAADYSGFAELDPTAFRTR